MPPSSERPRTGSIGDELLSKPGTADFKDAIAAADARRLRDVLSPSILADVSTTSHNVVDVLSICTGWPKQDRKAEVWDRPDVKQIVDEENKRMPWGWPTHPTAQNSRRARFPEGYVWECCEQGTTSKGCETRRRHKSKEQALEEIRNYWEIMTNGHRETWPWRDGQGNELFPDVHSLTGQYSQPVSRRLSDSVGQVGQRQLAVTPGNIQRWSPTR